MFLVGLVAVVCVLARQNAAVIAREAVLFQRFFGSSASPNGPSLNVDPPVGVDPDVPVSLSGPETDLALGLHTRHVTSQAFLDSLRDRL